MKFFNCINSYGSLISSSQRFLFLAIALLVASHSMYSQVNATEFENQTTIAYSDCSGTATVTFPVREDYSLCTQANQLRWIEVFSVAPDNSLDKVYSAFKIDVSPNLCAGGPSFIVSACRLYNYCDLDSVNSWTLVNGTGDQRFLQLTIKNLPEPFFGGQTKFKFYGFYDFECCENSTSLVPTNGFLFDFEKSVSGTQATVNPAMLSPVFPIACQNTNLTWANVAAPNNCGTVSYNIFRDGSFIANHPGTPYTDTATLTVGETYSYTIQSQWVPTNDIRVDTSNRSAQRSVTIPSPNGSISGTVKTPDGLPVPQVKVIAIKISSDPNSTCSSISPSDTIDLGTTLADGVFNKSNIYYGHPDDEETTYAIQGKFTNLIIDTVHISLDDDNPVATPELIDRTVYLVSGKVLSSNGCGVENSAITIKGNNPQNIALIQPDTTDSDGYYNIRVPGIDVYKIYSSYQTASTLVKDSTLRTVIQSNNPNTNINYSKKNTIQGFVGGDCGALFGPAVVKAYSLADNCLLDSTVSDAATGLYSINLHAHPVTISIKNFMPTSGALVGQTLNQSYDVVLDSTTIVDFIFSLPITATISGMPAQICADIPYPIVEQFQPYFVNISVVEGFGCPIDTGFVIVTDEISGLDGLPVILDTLYISNGEATDTIIPGRPNIFGDFTKTITYVAYSGNDLQTAIAATPVSRQAIVTGSAPRGQQFTTISPQIPRLIIRDPPGDASYSFIEEGNTFSTISSTYTQDSEGGSIWGKAKAGVEIFSLEVYAEIGANLGGSSVHLNSEETIREFTATSYYSTSDDPNINGSEGDVYIGAAINITYANSDIISLDLEACEINKRVELVINTDSFETEFIYAESDIINLIIPSLQAIVDDLLQSGSQRHRAKEGIKIWEQIINLNAELKEEAFNGIVTPLNKSFGGSAGHHEQTFTTTTTETKTIEWKQLFDENILVEAGFSLGGSGVSAGFEINLKQEFGGSTTNGVTTSTTTGFRFDDDDTNDLFTVDYAIDPVFGTPVFRAAQGAAESSCPWEIGAKRDKPYFSITNPTQYAGAGVNTLTYSFVLGNNSETGDTRDYTLEMVSNPNGAEVAIAGVTSQIWQYPAMPVGNQNINVQVTRNPANPNFQFEGIRFRFYPSCNSLTESLYRNISAFFESPCSEIGMTLPTTANGFVINENSDNEQLIRIGGYDYNNITATDEIIMEYAPAGTNAFTSSNIVLSKTDLVNNNPPKTNEYWQTNSISDGGYDIRMKLICMAGTNSTETYSERVSGIIDRLPPITYGVPQPEDDDYAMGDQISMTFNESLDTTIINAIIVDKNGNIPTPSTFSVLDNKIIITPSMDLSIELGKTFVVTLTGIIDLYENESDPISWEFTVGEIDPDGNGYTDNEEACIGSSLWFAQSPDHYISVPHHNNLNVVEGGDDFTFEAWINPLSSNETYSIISKGSGVDAQTEFIFQVVPGFSIYDGRLRLFLSGEWVYSYASSALGYNNLGNWSHVAVAVDGPTKTATFYIDGAMLSSAVFSTTTFHSGDATPLYIGQQGDACNCNFYEGRMDDVIIWQRELTQAQIMATMAGTLTGSETDLVAYYNFNDHPACENNIGNTAVIDKSANGHDGLLWGFALSQCFSNYSTERSMDSDRDGIPDGCDLIDPCFDLQDTVDLDGDLLMACVDLCPTTKDVALDFDGVDDFASIGFSKQLLNDDFAFEAWINPVDHIQEGLLIGSDDVRGELAFRLELRYQKLSLFLLDTAANNEGEYLSCNSDIPLNKWSHIAVSFNSETNQATFYLNGKFDGIRQSQLSSIYSPPVMSMFIGLACDSSATNSCPHSFNGRMDDLMIWSRSLSEYNIKQTMSAPLSGSENGLEGYYDFNEGVACADNYTITTLLDKSPNNYHAAFFGFQKYGSCTSNYVTGRNTDSDGDMIGDACDVSGFGCPPNYAGTNQLIGDQVNAIFFETDGAIESTQTLKDPAQVIYNSSTGVELLPEFEIKLGSSLEVKLDGCPD